jgi:HEAT repeat protein
MKGPIPAFIILIVASALQAQQPKVSDTNLRVEPITQNLAATIDRVRHSADRLWMGYEVPALPGLRQSTCSDWSDSSQADDGCCGEYRLEDDHGVHHSNNDGPAKQNTYILLRFEKRDLFKVRTAEVGCRLNAGGVDFAWVTGVKPEESIAFLAGQVNQPSPSSKVLEGALLAISVHASPEATHALEQIASSTASRHTREQAAFWLGVQRGHDGFLALKSLEDKSTEPEFREKLTFDFAQNSDPAAQDELVRMAKSDPEAKVRGQALFWIAQKAGKRATLALTDAIQNDPETDVKKKAVFALSQLPKDESIPQLIHVADTNMNLAVRKEAFFWLGQSQDPRALAYLEQVLKR